MSAEPLRWLVVDDDPVFAETLARALRRRGYAVAASLRRGSTQPARGKWHVYPFGKRSR